MVRGHSIVFYRCLLKQHVRSFTTKILDMLIFQLHLPHVIPNSMQALHALSHLEIIIKLDKRYIVSNVEQQ